MIVTTSLPYRVLARKYRPQTFESLIGQEAMVRTLANAIKRDRLAHAFLLTGVRGVGKTTTARLIAKAVNCIGADGQGGPTIEPCDVCEPCVSIAEGRHIDVVEMDAASNTGVDDVREIIEAVRYAAVSARYKVYIIDEVHMLSKNAFNALLKTLEEPPPHVKFLFATTEVNKVPVTVLSRCQRFDLRRISTDVLATHFRSVSLAEHVDAEPEALAIIARAAEGSVRDGLSILDQAIAHADLDGEARITANQVRAMLGLTERKTLHRLLGVILEGNAIEMLSTLENHHSLGVDPIAIMRGLLELVHAITRFKAGAAPSLSATEEERTAVSAWASQMSFSALHRLWQMLLKGHDETARAFNPAETAEMALLRVIHAASMPDPGRLAQLIENGGGLSAESPIQPAAPIDQPASFADMVGLLEKSGKYRLARQLHDDVGEINYAPPLLVIKPFRPFDVAELKAALKIATGVNWTVELSDGDAKPSLFDQTKAAEIAARDMILSEPLVATILTEFPEAELLDWSEKRSVNA